MSREKEEREDYCFEMEMEVRDYELDCESIVNNANYLHYMEHTRHCYCRQAGVPFLEMHSRGLDAVATRIEIDYKSSLRGGDVFRSCLRVERQGVRFVFYQDIFRGNGELCAHGVVTVVLLDNGKLSRGDELAGLLRLD